MTLKKQKSRAPLESLEKILEEDLSREVVSPHMATQIEMPPRKKIREKVLKETNLKGEDEL